MHFEMPAVHKFDLRVTTSFFNGYSTTLRLTRLCTATREITYSSKQDPCLPPLAAHDRPRSPP